MQIQTFRNGFEAFECKFELLERGSRHSNQNSNHSKGIQNILMPNVHYQSPDSPTVFFSNMILMSWECGQNTGTYSFNESKCSLVRFGPMSSSSHVYSINSCEIQSDSQHKDLGVIVSSNLSWSNHIHYITTKAYKILGLLRRAFRNCSPVLSKKLLYISLVRSQLTYGSQVWRPYLLKDIDALEAVQRRSTKFILNDYTSDYKFHLLSLQLLPLMMLYELNDILFFVKSFKEPNVAFNVHTYFTLSSNRTRSTSHHKLVHKLARSNVTKDSSIDSLVCGMLSPLSTSIPLSHQLNSILSYSFGIILSATLILTIHALCIFFVLVPNVSVLKFTLLSNCIVSVILFSPSSCNQ